ncbi:MAG: ABC transporter permease [Chloroflexi bacterium]|nr:ABC transporter permease [Chloroflexota bacterium]
MAQQTLILKPAAQPLVRQNSELSKMLRQITRNPLSIVGIVLVLTFAGIAVFAPVIAPAPAGARDAYIIPRDGFKAEPQPPDADHLFGTTEGQYDIFYGVVWGTRTAFLAGIVIVAMALVVGLTVGSVAAYFGGWVDDILMRITEIFLAFPFLVAALTLAAVLQPKLGRGLYTGIIALVVFGWMGYARLIRGDILATKEREYVTAARAMGVRDWRILLRHILPNAIFPVMVVASLEIGTYVLSFAALSFLGLGAELGYADWGQMLALSRNWITNLSKYWYIVVYPGVALLFFVLGWNLIGDALRDIVDPRLRGGK